MLKNSFSDVRFNNEKGEEWRINRGWIISPMLFTFYIKGCFEDFIVHMASTLRFVEVDKKVSWYLRRINKKRLDFSKSESLNIWFKKNKKDIIESSVKLYDEIFQRVSQCKFGITLTNYMSNSVDSCGVLNKFLRQYNSISMYHIFNFPSREINNQLLKKYLLFFFMKFNCGK